jgi:hypothetical protein
LIKCTPRQRRRPGASGLCSVRNAREHNHIAQYTDEAALYTVRQAGINLNYITHTQGIIIINKEIIKKGKKIGLKSLSIYNKHPAPNTDRLNNNNIPSGHISFLRPPRINFFLHLFAASAALLSTIFKGGINLAQHK